MKEYLNARHDLITNVAVITREMLDNSDCNDWKWDSYKERLAEIAKGEPEKEEKNKDLKKMMEAIAMIVVIFLFLVCICGAFILWIAATWGVIQFFCGDITFWHFVVRVVAACAFSSPIIFIAMERN